MENRPINPTEFIRSAINIFLFVAIAISLFQELSFTSKTPVNPDSPDAVVDHTSLDVPQNGTHIDGLIILTTDHFTRQFKQILVQKNYNIQIKDYPFQGEQYWINLFLTHGHMIVVFFLVSKYQAEQDQGRKTKLMIFGMILVFGWMFASPHLRSKKLGLQYKGQKIYENDVFVSKDIADKLAEYDEIDTFGLEPQVSAKTVLTPSSPPSVQEEEEFIPISVDADF